MIPVAMFFLSAPASPGFFLLEKSAVEYFWAFLELLERKLGRNVVGLVYETISQAVRWSKLNEENLVTALPGGRSA